MRRRFVNVAIVMMVLSSAACRSGLDLSKSSTQLQVGVRAARMNLWREALFRFNRAVQIDPENALALNNLAVAYEGTGDFEKARSAYTEALRLDRTNQHIQKNYSRFVEFYTRNKKRERPVGAAGNEEKAEKQGEQTPAPTPVVPPSAPVPEPDGEPLPPEAPPATAPPVEPQLQGETS